MPQLVSDATAQRIKRLLNRFDLDTGRRGTGAPVWAFVRCTSATAVGGNSVLDQCYPAIILSPACDYAAPPEEGFGALLTVLGDSGDSVAPREGAVYACLLTGEVESDRTGSGPSLVNGRPRAFGVPVPGPESAWKIPVRAATTTGGTLSSSFANGSTIDGVLLATGDRVLIKDQGSKFENGIYVVAASGAPTRASDANSATELLGACVAVEEGTKNHDTVWLCTANAPITPGATDLPWAKISFNGTGTDNHIVRWDGTDSVQDSGVAIDDSDTVSGSSWSITDAGLFTGTKFFADSGYLTGNFLDASGLTLNDAGIYITIPSSHAGGFNLQGSGTFLRCEGNIYAGVRYFASAGALSGASPGIFLAPKAQLDFFSNTAPGLFFSNSNASQPFYYDAGILFDWVNGRLTTLVPSLPFVKLASPGFVTYDSLGGALDGLTGTLGPGAKATGGLITDLGSGSFVGTATANTFTAPNSFQASASTDVPMTVQAAASQSGHLTDWKDSGGSVLSYIGSDGTYHGNGSGLTNLNAANLTGTLDLGTW